MNGDGQASAGFVDPLEADEDQVRETLLAVSFEEDVLSDRSLDPLATCPVCNCMFGSKFGFKAAWDHCCFWPDHSEVRKRVIDLINSVTDDELMNPDMVQRLLEEFGFKAMPDLSQVDPKAPPPGKPVRPRSLKGCKSEQGVPSVPQEPQDKDDSSSSTPAGDVSPPRKDGVHYLADKEVREIQSALRDSSGDRRTNQRSRSRKASRQRSRKRSRDRSKERRNKSNDRSRGRRRTRSRSAGRSRRGSSRRRRR
eukprot:gnl/MRDRNA2_/MRDRNA2_147224_c0_seq1.p1 gnl/MRDRNA2_/MRDRNA2_147224_c0~~gnl/MRDRNA2_/MRDRNA2_147224_c0_seq1.p1  ORF type:complete len:253 (-),score=40.25 gnl/MRDRNA2_/MRDRNA2_147224_c0_seq1:5-763(-)